MKSTKVLGFAAIIAAMSAFSSCSNDNEPTLNPNESLKSGSVLVSAPTINAWSGDEDFTGPRKVRRIVAEGNTPEAVSESEIAAAKAFFNNSDNFNPVKGGEFVDITELNSWRNYYVQEVVSGNELPSHVAIYVGTNKESVDNIAIWDMDPEEVVKLLDTEAYITNEAKVAVDPNATQLVTGHPIKDISFETTGYSFGNAYYEGVRSSGHKGQFDWQANYKIAALDGYDDAVYVALYGYTDSNNGYWNRIIKISLADVADAPEEPEVEEPEGVVSDKILHNHEVEVNLAINDTHRYYNDEDLTSKLSIHVRSAKDVKVRIPVPVEILVPADDLDIAIAHPDFVYGEDHKAEIDINGHIVEVSVAFTEATDCAGNGYGYYIEVTTKGINQDVINYCMEQNADGLNFEVFNYYQWNVTDDEGNTVRLTPTPEQIRDLKENWLDKSTVEFGYDNGTWMAYTNISQMPYYYINAFHSNSDNDCVVSIISNQSYAFENHYVGAHINGSDNNVIYVRNDIFGTDLQDDAHQENPAFAK